MGEVIVITSGKGGVGKTTTTANLGSALALKGKKVVLVDTDIGLRNLDVVMGLENRIVYDIVDVVEEKCKLKQALIKDKRFKDLFLLPAAQTRDKSAVNEEQMIELTNKLKEELRNYNIDATVETKDIVGEVKAKNLAYKDTYKITRELVTSKMNENIVLYIDLHRDSVKREFTTAQVDDKSYAKMLFVVGGKHDTYKENYQVCDEINKYIKNNNNAFSRGILVRKNSSYNQDLASNIILIELGSQDNTIEEVNNTIGVLANALSSYINE